jgi:hypothetical protein
MTCQQFLYQLSCKFMKKILSALFISSILISGFSYTRAVYAQSTEPDICNFEAPSNAKLKYDFEFLGSRKKLSFNPGELNQVTIFIQNTGTIPIFSDGAGCTLRPVIRLGTAKPNDHESPLYTSLQGEDSRWISFNRIKLDQNRLDPGERGSFTFWTRAPMETGIYREYFDVVLEGKQWFNKPFVINFDVGDFVTENRDYLQYVTESKLIKPEDLLGPKSIEVDVSQQKMYLKVGNITIRTFPVSTGKPSTPTPYGHTQILYKQEVRVSASWPHYIMPKWLNFRKGGFGIHALPSIRYDNGYYWREALSHIGQARSHGCIRLLPADAAFTYDWAEVGTAVWVHA